jgi:hypothetical protein
MDNNNKELLLDIVKERGIVEMIVDSLDDTEIVKCNNCEYEDLDNVDNFLNICGSCNSKVCYECEESYSCECVIYCKNCILNNICNTYINCSNCSKYLCIFCNLSHYNFLKRYNVITEETFNLTNRYCRECLKNYYIK